MAPQIEAQPHPPLNAPKSSSTVRVSIINCETDILSPSTCFVKPLIPGQEFLNMPTFAFLLQNETKNKQILFDCGSRKDWWNLAKANVDLIMTKVPGAKVDRDVNEILRAGNVDDREISSVIWSHWHWDHTGDPSLFPPSTEVVVGPGFKTNFMPGYPTNPNCPVLDSDFEGREVREIGFDDNFNIGGFPAHDFFGDGSFYLLDTPGHAQGHISGLARTTEDTFVFMGGDICHYGGAYRPTEYAPMPSHIPDSVPLDSRLPAPCPCSIFTACHPSREAPRSTPYYQISDSANSWYNFPDKAQRSVDTLKTFDAASNVLVCIAHDVGLQPVLDFFPNGTINDWHKKGWKEATSWGFVNELPIDGKPGRPWLVDGLYKNGKIIGGGQEVLNLHL